MNISLNSDLVFKEVKKGELLFKQDSTCVEFYIVTKGKICAFNELDGRAIPIYVHSKDELIGEESALQNKYIYNATALEDSELVVLKSSDFNNYLNANSMWIKNILTEISSRIQSNISSLTEHKIIGDEQFGSQLDTSIEKILLDSLKL